MRPEIQKATDKDIAKITKIYDHILNNEENGQTATGWIRGLYPTEKTARAALEAGDLFVMTQDEDLIAAARINQKQVPEY